MTEDPAAERLFTRGREVTTAIRAGRRSTLEAIRDVLAGMMDGSRGHEVGCGCECGTPADAKGVPALAKELRAVIAELDDLPTETGGSELGDIAAQRQRRRDEAARLQAEGQ